MTLGEKLQLLRRSRGLSQEQLAAELDVSRQAISKWECGDSTPDLDKLRAICTYFGVTTDYLIWENEEDIPSGSAKAAAEEKKSAEPPKRENVRETLRKRRLGGLCACHHRRGAPAASAREHHRDAEFGRLGCISRGAVDVPAAHFGLCGADRGWDLSCSLAQKKRGEA